MVPLSGNVRTLRYRLSVATSAPEDAFEGVEDGVRDTQLMVCERVGHLMRLVGDESPLQSMSSPTENVIVYEVPTSVSQIPGHRPPMPVEELVPEEKRDRPFRDFRPGDRVDGLDCERHWYPGTIVRLVDDVEAAKASKAAGKTKVASAPSADTAGDGVAEGAAKEQPPPRDPVPGVVVHFDGFASRWDEVFPVESERLVPVRTHTVQVRLRVPGCVHADCWPLCLHLLTIVANAVWLLVVLCCEPAGGTNPVHCGVAPIRKDDARHGPSVRLVVSLALKQICDCNTMCLLFVACDDCSSAVCGPRLELPL